MLLCTFSLLLLAQFKITQGETVFCPGTIDLGTEPIDFKSRSLFGILNTEPDGLTCELTISIPENFYAIRIDFVRLVMDGQSLYADRSSPGHCESDMFFFKGFKSWTPPARCGDLEGYSFLIDKDAELKQNSFKIVALMSTSSFKWHIRISQVFRPHSDKVELGLSAINKELSAWQRWQRNTSATIPLVMHGVPTHQLSIPYLVNIRENEDPWMFRASNCDVLHERLTKCGGSIIGHKFVVTAASCFYQTSKYYPRNSLRELEVVAGDTNVCEEEQINEQLRASYHKISNVVYHYGFDPYLHLHDIAIVVLQTPFKYSDHIKPIKLGRTSDTNKPLNGQISGFGAWDLEPEGYSILKSTFLKHKKPKWYFPFQAHSSELTLSPSSECSFSKINSRYGNLYGEMPFKDIKKYAHVPKSMRCAIIDSRKQQVLLRGTMGSPGSRDNGGPFVATDDDELYPRLSGIILKPYNNPWGVVKGEELFLSVPYYRNWIKSVIASFQ